MSKDNGGCAFPVSESGRLLASEDMMLRDYFAAKAMQAVISNNDHLMSVLKVSKEDNIDYLTGIAQNSYEIADAMIRARDK